MHKPTSRFQGIVQGIGIVRARSEVINSAGEQTEIIELKIAFPEQMRARTALAVGAEVAVNGVCLTIRQIEAERIGFWIFPETLARTTLAEAEPGQRVNLEYPL